MVEFNTSYYFVPTKPFVEDNLMTSLAFLSTDHILVHQFNTKNDEQHSFLTFDGDIFCGYMIDTSTPLSEDAIIDINGTMKYDSFEFFIIGNRKKELENISVMTKPHIKNEFNAGHTVDITYFSDTDSNKELDSSESQNKPDASEAKKMIK